MTQRNFLMFLGREKHDLPKYHESYNHNLPKIIKNGHFLTFPKKMTKASCHLMTDKTITLIPCI